MKRLTPSAHQLKHARARKSSHKTAFRECECATTKHAPRSRRRSPRVFRRRAQQKAPAWRKALNMKRLTPTHTQLKLARPPPARARGSPHPLSADIARPARVEKKVLMSHKISIFQLVSIVKFYICAGTRSAGFLDGAQEVNFCQKRPKNLDISPFFSTRAMCIS